MKKIIIATVFDNADFQKVLCKRAFTLPSKAFFWADSKVDELYDEEKMIRPIASAEEVDLDDTE